MYAFELYTPCICTLHASFVFGILLQLKTRLNDKAIILCGMFFVMEVTRCGVLAISVQSFLAYRFKTYFWRQFSAILAASQLYFVDILIIGYNIKGQSKSFSLQSALRFLVDFFVIETKKSTKKLYLVRSAL